MLFSNLSVSGFYQFNLLAGGREFSGVSVGYNFRF